jgi:hypothetical protein
MTDYFQYRTKDNGGEPYIVNVYADRCVVFDNYEYEHAMDEYNDGTVFDELYEPVAKVLLDEDDVHNIFLGDNLVNDPAYMSKGDPRYLGNSILIEGTHMTDEIQYIFVGDCIKAFNVPTDDRIEYFSSPVGNSCVPYPYAIGKKNTYFLLDDMYIPNEYLNLEQDGYGQFYELPDYVKFPFSAGYIKERQW